MTTAMRWTRCTTLAMVTAGLALAPRLVHAQGEVTDSLGRFTVADIPVGDHVLQVRALGYREVRSEVILESNEVIVRDVALARTAQVLAGTTVTATAPTTAKMAGFMERKERGTGHFITRDKLADAEGGFRRTGTSPR